MITEILEIFYFEGEKQRFNVILIKIKEVLMNILLLVIRKEPPVDTLSYSTFMCVWDTAPYSPHRCFTYFSSTNLTALCVCLL